jgi:hypothetical protein
MFYAKPSSVRRHTVQNLPALTLAHLKGLPSPELLVNVQPEQVPVGVAVFLMGRGFGVEVLPFVCAIMDAKLPRHIQTNSRSNAVEPLSPRFLEECGLRASSGEMLIWIAIQ